MYMKIAKFITLIFAIYYSSCTCVYAMEEEQANNRAIIAALAEEYKKQIYKASQKTSPTLPRRQTPKQDVEHAAAIKQFPITEIPENSILEIRQPSPQKPKSSLENAVLALTLQTPMDK